jgi:C1A family cysteine protease
MATPPQISHKIITLSNGAKHVLDHRFGKEKDARDFLFKARKPDILTLPVIVDLRKSMPPVLNQGELGSCGSNALANAIRYDLRKESRESKEEKGRVSDFPPSRLYIYYNTRAVENEPLNEDTGITLRGGCKSLSKYSACNETIWPYVIANFAKRPPLAAYKDALVHKTIRYESVLQNLTSLKQCLSEGYPVVFGFRVYTSFMSEDVAKTGIVPLPKKGEKMEGGHAVVCCGYDSDKSMFICQNSWGEDWGDKGYFYMPFDYMVNRNLADDFWKISYFS